MTMVSESSVKLSIVCCIDGGSIPADIVIELTEDGYLLVTPDNTAESMLRIGEFPGVSWDDYSSYGSSYELTDDRKVWLYSNFHLTLE